jgi:N-acetylglutamate synthase-like GNAT family acetyltransferase
MRECEVITYRKARAEDFEAIVEFVDMWLSGRKSLAEKGGSDYFVTYNQQKNYLRNYHVLLAFDGDILIGWGVKEVSGVMIHLLVAGNYRGLGIGRELLKRLHPDIVRVKIDQSMGDPRDFYRKANYIPTSDVLVGRRRNIQFFERKLS